MAMCIDEVKIPRYSLAEELLNSISHGLGAIFGIVALVLMLIKTIPTGDPFAIVSSIIYGLSLIILFTISCVYHALAKNKAKKVLRILLLLMFMIQMYKMLFHVHHLITSIQQILFLNNLLKMKS